MIEKIREAAAYLQNRITISPQAGIILGTGLGKLFVKGIQNAVAFSYKDIPHFPVSTVESHEGKLIFGSLNGKYVVVMQGRFHFYEGYSMEEIALPVRVMKLLAVKYLLISNAAGNLNSNFKKGDLMLIDDHINFQTDNPLRGRNLEEFGPRFPDMSEPYAKQLNDRLINIARRKGIALNVGVYAGVPGPNLETRAEYRFLRTIGADAVGMSTIPEVIVANHCGMPCCAISVLTDDCDPDNLKPANIHDIIAVAHEAEPKLTELYTALIRELNTG